MVLDDPGAANPPANTCSNVMGAASDSAFIGLVYAPSASISVQKASAFRTDESGGVIASTLTFSGQLPTIIGDTDEYGPVPPAAKIIDYAGASSSRPSCARAGLVEATS